VSIRYYFSAEDETKRVCGVDISLKRKREKYSEDSFLLNQTTMTVARTTVFSTAYCLDGEKRVLLLLYVLL